MARFFINRPIVAIVISIIFVLLGIISMLRLPISKYPNITPPEVQILANYPGADALTVEQAVATPIEEQMSGVDNMIYMTSINANNGSLRLSVDFKVGTDPNIDQVLAQMRYTQAEPQLPADVRNLGVTIRKATASPLALFSLYSPNGTHNALFLANYATINILDPMTRIPGVGQVAVFGAGTYAMRFWVNPDVLASRGITVNEVLNAISTQNTVNPAGQVGGEPIPQGQQFTYSIRAQGRLSSPEQFADIIVRANPDGSVVRMKDISRVELGAQTYSQIGRLNGSPAAIIAVYQLPDANAIATFNSAKALMEQMKAGFPSDLDYTVSLNTTTAVTEGIREIVITLAEALVLVIIVVFIFLQGFRATLIPMLAVPVSLIGAFIAFPLLGFSINTLSLFGLVLAIGLVVDDAIVVVEAVEHHIEEGMSPRDATMKAMEEVSGPVVAIALVLSAVFIPTAFIPGITGRMYQQFAITIALSVIISAFNALSLSPALSALLLRPRKKRRGPLGWFFDKFNYWFGRTTNGYISWAGWLIRKAAFSMLILLGFLAGAGLLGIRLPSAFIPSEDQGYIFVNVQLPPASSLERTDAFCKQVEAILKDTPGVQSFNTVVGFSLLSLVSTTYNGFFFVTLKPWSERGGQGLSAEAVMHRLNGELAKLPGAQAFTFSPPPIPGIGTTGGVTFILEDRSGQGIEFLAKNTDAFLAAARKRPELSSLTTTFLPNVPQKFVHVDRAKAFVQGVDLASIYKTLQVFMGGAFVNYFNEFGRIWQVYVEAEGKYRTSTTDISKFYLLNGKGQQVPLSTLTNTETVYGPEFTMRYNEFRSAQINGTAAPGYSSGQAMAALEQVFAETMPSEMGFGYMGMSFQEQAAKQGVPPAVIFGFSLVMVFLILAALYESWSLPFSVLLGTPIAVFGAFVALLLRHFNNDVFSQIGLVMLIGLTAKNAILIVEFAKREVERGRPVIDGALAGARLRLRPILMTAFAFIFGVLPLTFAGGAGALSRQILGTTVVGGMLAATIIAIFLIPVSFYVVEKLSRRGKDHQPPSGGQTGPEGGHS